MIRFRSLTRNIALKPATLTAACAAAQRAHAEKVLHEVKQYPPERAGSNYVRTGDLGRGWKVSGPRINPSGIVTTLLNDVYYVGFVQGEFQQAIHASTGWRRAMDLAARDEYRAAIQGAINSVIR